MTGMTTSTSPESRGLVTTIMMLPPTNSTRLRNAIDTEAPTVALICVVSAVNRDNTSPLLAVSKNAAESDVTCAKTAARRSATTPLTPGGRRINLFAVAGEDPQMLEVS